MFRQRRNKENADEIKKRFETNPLDELNYIIDELEQVVSKTKQDYVLSIAPPPSSSTSPDGGKNNNRRSSGMMDSIKKFRSRRMGSQVSSSDDEGSGDDDNNNEATSSTPQKSRRSPPSSSSAALRSSFSSSSTDGGGGNDAALRDAMFIPMSSQQQVAHCVELIRRLAELVVIGERAAAAAEKNPQTDSDSSKYIAIFEHFFERNGLALITNIVTGIAFDLKEYQQKQQQLLNKGKDDDNDDDDEEEEGPDDEGKVMNNNDEEEEDPICRIDFNQHNYLLLPQLEIATQAIQSVSILVQNVSRATSLFFILSNNHVNQLIDFPLDQYYTAEQKRKQKQNNPDSAASRYNTLSTSRRFGSPELAELTTHFITFLKSLALRMNTETLQFFLTYPPGSENADYYSEESLLVDATSISNPQETNIDDYHHHHHHYDHDEAEEDVPMDERIASNNNKAPNKKRHTSTTHSSDGHPSPVAVKQIKVEFPLYERALAFCSAHQDSFVRVTAMNICLNTLRLATVQPDDGEDNNRDEDADEPGAISSSSSKSKKPKGSSPDGVLHNAEPLPMKERMAIAQYVCTPARVEKLISPIFTKLAQLWGVLEEQFRDMDDIQRKIDGMSENASDKFGGSSGGGRKKGGSGDKVAKAKEVAKRKKAGEGFSSTAYNVQDELLLLDDVLKVGLTSLNEQTIEMMFATYIYPLLLQPLLLYFQRSPVSDDVLFADPLNDHSVGKYVTTSYNHLTKSAGGENSLISAPAKSALFSLAAVFQLLTNAPLLRLLFTAIFHPVSPHATGETMIRAQADVACVGSDGKVSVRTDPVSEEKLCLSNDRSTYMFGTVTGRKCASGTSSSSERTNTNDKETCIFVLSPALSEILEFDGTDPRLVARTRRNPYRTAIFQSFTISSQLSDLRPLSVMVVDSAVSAFGEGFVSSILFGSDLMKFEDTVPVEERKSKAAALAFEDDFDDDRGIGKGVASDSRLILGDSNVGALWHDYMSDVISAFRSCIIQAISVSDGSWKLEYDMVAAHALIAAIRGNAKALKDAALGVHIRCKQAASFLSEIPVSVEKTMEEGKKASKKKGDEKKDAQKRQYEIMDFLFRGQGLEDTPAVCSEIVDLKAGHRADGKSGYSVKVSIAGTYNLLTTRCTTSNPLDNSAAEAALNNAMSSARSWAKLDALSTLINSLVTTHGDTISKKQLGGLAAKRDGTFVTTFDSTSIYAPLSEHLLTALCEEGRDNGYFDARPGTVVSLVGQTALPCVCEVPPSSAPLFSEAGARVVSQGITWQSLYLVLLGRNYVLAEPERRSSGDGRVVTCCKLERVSIEVDTTNVSEDTSARRLIVSHDGPELDPPGLFLFEENPVPKDEGPFNRLKLWRSSLDVWFEDSQAVELAQTKVKRKIEEAKIYRGKRLQRYLAQGEDSGYPINISFGNSFGDTI